MIGTTAGATMAPRLLPALKRPVAKARSLRGNHSATVLIEAGKFADSPRPRTKRATPKPNADRANAWAMEARLQTTMATANPRFVPTRSRMRPATSRPRAYAAWKAVTMYPYSTSFQPMERCRSGARMPRTCRST